MVPEIEPTRRDEAMPNSVRTSKEEAYIRRVGDELKRVRAALQVARPRMLGRDSYVTEYLKQELLPAMDRLWELLSPEVLDRTLRQILERRKFVTSTAAIAESVGVHPATLERWISSRKLKPPRQLFIGKKIFRLWNQKDLERVKRFKKKFYRKGRGGRRTKGLPGQSNSPATSPKSPSISEG